MSIIIVVVVVVVVITIVKCDTQSTTTNDRAPARTNTASNSELTSTALPR